jgi:hypothetical protein
MSDRSLRFLIVASYIAAGWCAPRALLSQSAPPLQRLPHHSETSFANAANRWQLSVVDPESQADTVSTAVRAKRNAFWKHPLQKAVDAARGAAGMSVVGDYTDTGPEFPAEKGATWIIATFETFHVFAIDADRQLIYTEMNFRVDQVLKTPPQLSISPGALIDAGIPGGRIRSPNKDDINSWDVHPMQYWFQPGHKYLVQLLYEAQYEVFLPNKDWDVSSGKVQPDDREEIYRAEHGRSAIDGMSLADLVNYLPSVLPDEPKR